MTRAHRRTSATCPLPPSQNRLSLRIDAGELKYARAHGVAVK
jgi:uncharacterized protein (DUF1684 family)